MIRTFEVKYEFAETELRWQDFFFPGTIFTTNHVIWVSSTTPAGRIRFWIVTLSLPCDLYHISVWQHLCSHRYETWTERSEVPQYDYDHTVHWHGPSDNSSKKKEEKTMRTKDLLSWTSDVQNSVFSIKTESMTTMKIKYSQGIINKSANSPQRAPWCEIYRIKEIKVVQFCSLWLVAKLSWSN